MQYKISREGYIINSDTGITRWKSDSDIPDTLLLNASSVSATYLVYNDTFTAANPVDSISIDSQVLAYLIGELKTNNYVKILNQTLGIQSTSITCLTDNNTGSIHQVAITWGVKLRPNIWDISCVTSSETIHIQQSIEVIDTSVKNPELDVSSLGKMIGCSQGGIAGADIIGATGQYSMKTEIPAMNAIIDQIDSITHDIFDALGKTNSAEFQNFEVGSLLLVGGSGIELTGDIFNITLQFDVRKQEDVAGATDEETLNKKGHELVEVIPYTTERVNQPDPNDPDSTLKLSGIAAVRIHKVYNETDFNSLKNDIEALFSIQG